MSYRSGHYSEHTQHHHQHEPARAALRRPAVSYVSAASPSQAAEAGYTLIHAGKQVRFGPVVFWIVVGTVTMLGMWSAATGTYFAFRDDVLTRLIARQAEMQYAYEDRIAELRAKVDRTTILIAANGKIAKIWRNVRVDGHADEVLAAVQTI